MSLFIHSDDFKSGGNSSDGTWEFTNNLKGNWHVIGQHMDSQTIPWMMNGQNTLVFRIHDDRNNSGVYVDFEVNFDYATIGISDTPVIIVTSMVQSMQTAIDTVAIDDPYAATNVTSSTDTVNKTITFMFDAAVDVLWQNNFIFVTTILPAFDLPSDYPNQLHVTSFTISYANAVIDPKYLEVYIAESTTQYDTAFGSRPNLYFSTRDGEFTGQSFTIPDDTSNLTIQIRRLHGTIPVTLSANWYLVCSQAG